LIATELVLSLGTVYLVDPRHAPRRDLATALEQSHFRVRAYDDAESFLADYDPDGVACLVTEVALPGIDGLQLQRHLADGKSDIPVVFLVRRSDVPTAVTAMKHGAVDFLMQPFDAAAITTLVDNILGRARRARFERREARLPRAIRDRLTPREMQVLDAIAEGRLNKQIAAELGISIKTVEVHRANVMAKLKARTVAELMRKVLDEDGH